ncbi:protease modulator HflC [Candidatus Sumerlaeota bacterium]|nr:protease modulator HflC [Candidatus Sumerlaeota bacterium]
MKISPLIIVIALILGLAVVLLASAAYTVDETEQIIVTRFGRPIGDPIKDAGLHFKMPFIEKINVFEKRILEWDGEPNEVTTRDKTFISVDTYGRWRISDPLLYFQAVTNEVRAQTRLDDILDGKVRDAVANHDLIEIVRTSNRVPLQDESLIAGGAQPAMLEEISAGRSEIERQILADAAPELLGSLGIELLDIRFKRINYREEVREKIYDRMISERVQIADKFRSEGQGGAARIDGDRERDLKRIESEAYKQIQEIRGEADAKAIEIYAKAYGQTEEAYEFYEFIETLETYRVTLDESTMVILSTGGDFFKYLNGIDPDGDESN